MKTGKAGRPLQSVGSGAAAYERLHQSFRLESPAKAMNPTETSVVDGPADRKPAVMKEPAAVKERAASNERTRMKERTSN